MYSIVRRAIGRIPKELVYRHVPPLAIERRYFCKKDCTEKLGFDRVLCTVRGLSNYVSPWYILWKIGLPKNGIIKFRRGLKRFHYPWLGYSVPTAFVMGVGDVISQNKCNPQKNKCTHYDYYRTMRFSLIGFGLVGPIMCKWCLYLNKILRCNTRAHFIAKKIALDLFILSPVVLTLVITIYDMVNIQKKWMEIKELWNRRYKATFWEIAQVNMQTRPLMSLFLCYICPAPLRWYMKGVYETLFSAFVSCSFEKAKFGLEEPSPLPKSACKFHKDCDKKSIQPDAKKKKGS